MTNDPLPNLLDGTTQFMELANQMGTHVDPSMFTTGIPKALRELRRSLLVGADGEVLEYMDADDNDDVVEIVIAWGTLLAYVGPELAKAAADEVVRSNLAKVLGEGLPVFREDGKVMKPEGWTAPDIAGVLGVTVR